MSTSNMLKIGTLVIGGLGAYCGMGAYLAQKEQAKHAVVAERAEALNTSPDIIDLIDRHDENHDGNFSKEEITHAREYANRLLNTIALIEAKN